MTVHLNIEPTVQEVLAARARAMGLPLESLIENILQREASLREATSNPAGPEAHTERDRRFQSAIAWLAENRQRHVGKWIALQGSELIATGENAKEVYARVAGQPVPPLVIRVEEEEPPFAGW